LALLGVGPNKLYSLLDGSQLVQRDILKHSLHPILKKLGLEQGGLNIFRRFRITKLETAEVPAALQHTWSDTRNRMCPRFTKNS
jgi:hypothetical protein